MMPRFLLRTIYRAAQTMKVELPQSATRLIVAAAEAGWAKTDLLRIKSMFAQPVGENFEQKSGSVEDLLREWEELKVSDDGGGQGSSTARRE